jgi:sterol desaturase/sphingolipid hydroxylase (fatty acid hydroxylase superfamily)
MKRLLSDVITWTVFPAVFLGAMTAGVYAQGTDLASFQVLAGILIPVALLLTLLERLHPHVTDWNRFQGDFGADTGHLLTSMVVVPELINVGIVVAIAGLGMGIAGQGEWGVWPIEWPLLAQWALAMVLTEFGQYWAHRWGHEWPLLWRLHATHHSAPRLWWYNAGRFHPLDTAVQYSTQMLFVIPLGCPAEVILLFTLFTGVHGMFQHTNLRMRLGPLNYVFSMAELHRWHHSQTVVESNANYGANLILWDLVFGTFYWPKDRDPPAAIGLTGLAAFPQTWLAQLGSPFTWKRIEQLSREKEDNR